MLKKFNPYKKEKNFVKEKANNAIEYCLMHY